MTMCHVFQILLAVCWSSDVNNLTAWSRVIKKLTSINPELSRDIKEVNSRKLVSLVVSIKKYFIAWINLAGCNSCSKSSHTFLLQVATPPKLWQHQNLLNLLTRPTRIAIFSSILRVPRCDLFVEQNCNVIQILFSTREGVNVMLLATLFVVYFMWFNSGNVLLRIATD